MRRTTWMPALLAGLLGAAPAHAAAILYNTTDLGNAGYQFQTNADGSTYGVTSYASGVTYAFDKVPTTAISQEVDGNFSGPQAGSPEYSMLTLQDGSYKVGYSVDSNPNDPANAVKGNGAAYFTYPTFESPTNNWIGGSPAYPTGRLRHDG